jgi:transposase-like protein
VPEAMKVDEKKLFRESKMSLEEARKKYPEWYEKVVIGKDKSKARWKIEEKVHGNNPYALYDWWKAQIRVGAMYNHRYFCLMCLAIYGLKCGVPYEQVEEDVLELVPFMNAINPEDPFIVSDAESALECYDHRYCTFPIKDIEVISAIPIKRNRRNGRKQQAHLKVARMIQQLNDEERGTNWREGNGRPAGSGTKEKIIREYVTAHPNASVSEIAKALGVSRTTVYKHKDKGMEKMEKNQNCDYLVKLSNGEEVIIEAEPGLSEYDQMRLARLKLYQEHLEVEPAEEKSQEGKESN